jgi:hypothetical protein
MAKGKTEMLTAKKFAERAGVTYPTVLAWLKTGLVPGAEFVGFLYARVNKAK